MSVITELLQQIKLISTERPKKLERILVNSFLLYRPQLLEIAPLREYLLYLFVRVHLAAIFAFPFAGKFEFWNTWVQTEQFYSSQCPISGQFLLAAVGL